VIPNLGVHCGDPLGKGTGDPGYTFPVELSPEVTFDRPGRLAMANRETDKKNGSQFFITEVAAPYLNGRYTVFGQCEKIALITKLTHVPVASPMTGRPVEDLVMTRVTITRGR
jgi:peptidyl-prolyl cis-trans isomerase A (cyclophilin A)